MKNHAPLFKLITSHHLPHPLACVWSNMSQLTGHNLKLFTMNYNLKIENTVSPSKFKEAQGIESIDVKENPQKKGSYFMTDEVGNLIGGVSEELVKRSASGESVTPVISWVTPLNEDGTPSAEPFFLLHRKGEGAQTIFSL